MSLSFVLMYDFNIYEMFAQKEVYEMIAFPFRLILDQFFFLE